MDTSWYSEHLACPECRHPLALATLGATSCSCGFSVPSSKPLDLRPRRHHVRTVDLPLAGENVWQATLADCTMARPEITYSGPRAERDSAELLSAAEPFLKKGASLLDLGCGPRDQAAPAAHMGLNYVGIDFTSSKADCLADAHAIPFRDHTFDAVLAYAVLEHLYSPFIALMELARVLRPGGVFFGTVSQGEPFHDSFFHHTVLGVAAVFRPAGFRLLRLWPSYDTLHALAVMGKYPRVIRLVLEAVNRIDVTLPFLAPRKFLFGSGRQKELEELYRAASICFLAVRGESGER